MESELPWRRATLPLVAVGVVTALGVQFTLTTGVLEHEFTVIFSALSGLMFYGLAGTVYRGVCKAMPHGERSEQLQMSLFLLLVGGLAMSAVTLAIMYLFNYFRYDCYFGKGMPFFWLTWTPVVLFMAVVGLWTASRGWGWIRRPVFYVFLLLLISAYDWILMERGLRVVDPLFGVILAFDQRAAMLTPHLHIYQRIGVLLFTGTLWCTLLWRNRSASVPLERTSAPTLAGRWVAFLWAISLLYLIGAGSYAGLGLGSGKLYGTLSETRASEHFQFHFAPHGQAAANIDQTIRHAEWNWARLTALMGIAPTKKVTIQLTEDTDMLWELSGMRAANAGPWRMIINDDAIRTDTFFHELVHALDLGDARSDPATTTSWDSRLKLLRLGAVLAFYRGSTEGIAQAYSEEFAMTPVAHRQQAAALVEDKLPSAVIFMGRGGFRTLNEYNAYNLAGSFMGYLVLTYGNEAMNTFLDDRLDYERAFGKDLAALDEGWREFLAQVPVSSQDVLSMGRSFDPSVSKGYKEECCPKLGSRTPDQEDQAYEDYRRGRFDASIAAYEALFDTTGDLRFRVHQINVLRAKGDARTALGEIEACLSDDTLSATRVLEFSRLKQDCLTELRDWDAVYALHARWAEIEPDADGEALRMQRLVAQEAYRERMAILLTARDDYERRAAAESLKNEFPDDEDIAYVYLAQVYGRMWPAWNQVNIMPENRSKLEQLLPYLSSNPDVVDKVGRSLERFIDRAIFASDFDLAERIVSVLAAHTKEPMRAHRMAVLSERIAFEKGYGSGGGRDESEKLAQRR